MLDKYNVEVIGVQVDAIERGEDRIEFKKAMDKLGIEMARSEVAYTVDEALANTQLTSDLAETKDLYSIVNRKVQEDVPMISAYVISAQGAMNKRLVGAQPSVYGFFNDVHNWDVK